MIQPKMTSANQADGSFNHTNFAKPVIVHRVAKSTRKIDFFDSDEEEAPAQAQPVYQAAQNTYNQNDY
jgi:hypothetical protein